MTPKLIYFAQRHPSLDPAAFTARWRAHGALGMSLPRWHNVIRYTQAATTDHGTLRMENGSPCDGVAAVTFRSEAARRAHVADPDAAITRADEATTFAHPVARSAHLVREIALLPHLPESSKMYLRIFSADGTSRNGFAEHWQRSVGPSLAAALHAVEASTGYSQNHLRDVDGHPPAAAVIDEVSFSSRTAAGVLITHYSAALAAIAAEVRLDWVVVREAVLWPPKRRAPA